MINRKEIIETDSYREYVNDLATYYNDYLEAEKHMDLLTDKELFDLLFGDE